MAFKTPPRGDPKFEFQALMFKIVREQRKLVQPLLKLSGRFHHRRAGGGPMAGLTPVGDGFSDKPSLFVMLREELRLSVHQLWRMGFERFRDLGVQLLPSAA